MIETPVDGRSRSRWGRVVLLAPLRHRAFRLLFAGQVVSDLGDWLDILALLALIAYQWRLGATALAALTMTMLLPSAVVAPITGVLVDRWPRRHTMIACDLARAALSLMLVWAPGIGVVLAVVLARSIFGTLCSPARVAAVRLTVPADDLLPANALSRLSVNVTKVVGPGLGGVLVALVGLHGAFVADALSFVVSATLLARLALHEPPRDGATAADVATHSTAGRWLRELRVGIGYIRRSPVLTVAVGAQMVEMLIVESNDSFSVLAFKGLGMGEALVGLAIGCSGLGNVAGALTLGQWGHQHRPLRLMGAGMALVGSIEAALGGALALDIQSSANWFPALVLGGMGFAAIWVPYSTLIQRETPPELLGRVYSTASALYTAIGLAGLPLGAVLVARIGLGPLFALTGAALLLAGVVLALWSRGAAPT